MLYICSKFVEAMRTNGANVQRRIRNHDSNQEHNHTNMIINIKQPQSFSEIGRKDNQEDFLWPAPASVTKEQRVFIMCDGVGGQDSGEVASSTAATALGEYLTANWPADNYLRKEHFEAALSHAYDALDAMDNGAARKMATTMTCIAIHRGGVLVAHIGDSRVYQLRPSLANAELERSGVVYQTEDHSLVNDLLRVGELTPEEAANFTQKNVITRAMQPNQENRCRADIYNITDVQTGDYFFLCCDGVLEQLSNQALGSILANASLDNDEKILAIKQVCDGNTHDNYTCWLVPVGQVVAEACDAALDEEETVASVEAEEEEYAVSAEPEYTQAPKAAPLPPPAPRPTTRPMQPQPVKTRSINAITVATIIVAIIALGGAVAAYFINAKDDKKAEPAPTEVTVPAPSDNDDPAAAPQGGPNTREIHHYVKENVPGRQNADRPNGDSNTNDQSVKKTTEGKDSKTEKTTDGKEGKDAKTAAPAKSDAPTKTDAPAKTTPKVPVPSKSQPAKPDTHAEGAKPA